MATETVYKTFYKKQNETEIKIYAAEAEHATNADNATNANRLNGKEPNYYATAETVDRQGDAITSIGTTVEAHTSSLASIQDAIDSFGRSISSINDKINGVEAADKNETYDNPNDDSYIAKARYDTSTKTLIIKI